MKGLIVLILLLVCVGCGARKVSTNIAKSTTEQNSDITDKTKESTTEVSTNETSVSTDNTQEEKGGSNTGLKFSSDKPVEITKDGIKFTPNGPVWYSTSSFYENRIQSIKDSTSKITDSLTREVENYKRTISSLEEKLYSKDKNTDSEGNIRPIAWAAFGIFSLAVIGYFLYKYFTNPKRKL